MKAAFNTTTTINMNEVPTTTQAARTEEHAVVTPPARKGDHHLCDEEEGQVQGPHGKEANQEGAGGKIACRYKQQR